MQFKSLIIRIKKYYVVTESFDFSRKKKNGVLLLKWRLFSLSRVEVKY